jgi:hypothetical protein
MTTISALIVVEADIRCDVPEDDTFIEGPLHAQLQLLATVLLEQEGANEILI